MNIKKYRIEHEPTGGEIEISIDFDYSFMYGRRKITMDENIREMAEFWVSSPNRIRANNNSLLNTFLKSLCAEVLLIAKSKSLNVSGVIREFVNKEGWSDLDGKSGIKLLSISDMVFDNQDDYSIEELNK